MRFNYKKNSYSPFGDFHFHIRNQHFLKILIIVKLSLKTKEKVKISQKR